MKTNVQALKELYVKMGGSLTDTYEGIADGAEVGNYVTIADMIQAVAQIAGSGGGSGLPDVSGADNGDVLTVVEGAWAKAAPEKEIDGVAFIFDAEHPNNPSCTKTAEQIYQMNLGDQIITAQYHDENGVNQRLWQLHCKRAGEDPYTYDIVFSNAYAERSGDSYYVTVLTIRYDNENVEWKVDYAVYDTADPLPAVTAADAGKVLTVSSGGAWEAAASAAPKVYVCNATLDTSANSLTLNTTVNQLAPLLQSGYVVLINALFEGNYYSYLVASATLSSDNTAISARSFVGVGADYENSLSSSEYDNPIVLYG